MPLFTLAGSEVICVLWTHYSIFFFIIAKSTRGDVEFAPN